ncbi:PD-(D/E)XK nuclease-like domain-containing protein [Fibrella forsythiae]|uniref:PD-(D/E)XK nuclease-like domain-containing protein n=1 Tax=Fibrella forsythiae TaxID=2817061 RepID=A0ABS3JDF1_9BACT|nr:PD-(D/E)XK nuclease-like domain-containing protein [Fibrella forsythiae]MBO0947476.1 PD-(D/E)XK nuclease-like domain-containing protein [Fibrella forsythiae]
MTNEAYRAVMAYANSDLGELARLRMPTLGPAHKPEKSNAINPKAAAFGTTFHTMILEPHLPIDWSQHHVTERDKLNQMQAAFLKSVADSDTYDLSSGFTSVEKSLFWECPNTGLALKCRIDAPHYCFKGTYLIDLKSTSCWTAQQFFETIMQYRYDCQAAYYLDGYAACNEGEEVNFLFIGVQKNKPFNVYYVDMSQSEERRCMIEYGRMKNRRLLRDAYDESLKADGWRPSSWSRIQQTVQQHPI